MKIALQHDETLPTLASPNEPTERKTTARLTLDKADGAWVIAPHTPNGEISVNIEHSCGGIKVFIYTGGRGQLRFKSYDFNTDDGPLDVYSNDANVSFIITRVEED